ncbi:MAG: hypothetical protein WBW84_11650 [Acidobacteriaceae bacterium]
MTTAFPTKGNPVKWVISQNWRRRHLTKSQSAAVAVKAKPMLEAEAKERQTAAGAANLAKYNGKSSGVKNDTTRNLLK